MFNFLNVFNFLTIFSFLNVFNFILSTEKESTPIMSLREEERRRNLQSLQEDKRREESFEYWEYDVTPPILKDPVTWKAFKEHLPRRVRRAIDLTPFILERKEVLELLFLVSYEQKNNAYGNYISFSWGSRQVQQEFYALCR